MKKVTILTLAVIFGMGILVTSVHAAEKLAYVDLSKIFSEYKKTKDYDDSLSSKEEAYTKARDGKVDEIKKFQDKLSLLSDAEREKSSKELESKIRTLREFDSKKQRELRQEQDTKMKEILKDIEETVKKYAEKNGITMVLNDRVLIYQTKTLDITDKIISRLNKSY